MYICMCIVEAQADIRCPPQSLFALAVCVCARVCVHMCACMLPQGHVGRGVYRGQKRVSTPPELELQAVACRQNMGHWN